MSDIPNSMESAQIEFAAKSVTKRHEAEGLDVGFDRDRFVVNVPEDSNTSRADLAAVEVQINEQLDDLKNITPDTAEMVLDFLQPFTERQEFTDLVLLRDAVVGTNQDRIERLAEIRIAITDFQRKQLGEQWKDPRGLTNAAVFVRSKIHILGLKTVMNTLEATSPRKKRSNATVDLE